MHGAIPVTWSLRGEVNSEEFTLAGEGSADLASGATELHLSAAPGFPTGFDPAVSHLMCNFALAGYAAVPAGAVSMRDAVARELFVRPSRQVVITDASGEQIVRLEALTTMTVAEDAISVTNYMTGISQLPAAVVRAYGEETLVPGAPGAATGIAQYKVELDNGQVLDGMTVVPYRFDRRDVWVSPALRAVRDQVCERTSATDVTLRAASQWQELVLTVAELGA